MSIIKKCFDKMISPIQKGTTMENQNKLFSAIKKICITYKTEEAIKEELSKQNLIAEFTDDTLDLMLSEEMLKLKFVKDRNHPKQQYKKQQQTNQTKQTERVLDLLNRFNNGDKVCIKQLQEASIEAYEFYGSKQDLLWFNENTEKPMSDKSIRRDLDIVKKFFPESFELITGEKGCYKSLNSKVFDNFLNPETLSLMVQTFNIAQRNNMFDSFDINDTDKKMLKKKAKEKSSVYEFKNRPFETKESDTALFHTLEHNIKYNKSILIEYENNDKSITEIEVKPYKILFMNDNFYLACANDKYIYSTYRISKIMNVKELGKKFNINPEIEEFIKDIQTPFSMYSQGYRSKLIKVTIEVNKDKAYFFKVKKYLISQNVEGTNPDNGNLIVSFTVTQEREMEELIKKWLPSVKVIEPISLKNKIENELKTYLGI